MSFLQGKIPGVVAHSRKPDGGSSQGTHSLFVPQLACAATAAEPQSSAAVPWVMPGSSIGGSGGGSGGGRFDGEQPVSVMIGGSNTIDSTQGTPLQTPQARIAPSLVQPPSHPVGGSNDSLT